MSGWWVWCCYGECHDAERGIKVSRKYGVFTVSGEMDLPDVLAFARQERALFSYNTYDVRSYSHTNGTWMPGLDRWEDRWLHRRPSIRDGQAAG